MTQPYEVAIQHKRMRIGKVNIYYQVAGAGKPVVLIHGLSGSSRWWSRNISALAEQFRVYVVDLVGFGDSRGHPFALHEAAGLLAPWMRQLGVGPASVVGHSMGGHIAAELAADYPDLVERLVLVDAVVLPFDQNTPFDHARGMLREARQMALNFMPILLTDALRAGIGTIWKAATELLMTDLRPKLERIAAPTLVIWGEHDALVPLEMGKRLSRYLHYDELVIVKGAGHNPMWDCPRAFNQVVAEFLNAQPAASPERTVECGEKLPAPRPRRAPARAQAAQHAFQ